jgi:predicted DCC family thiol-disulfide oxidoreductase YuxK
VLDRAHRLEFVPLQEAGHRPGRPELAALAASRPLDVDLHVILPGGRVESDGRAAMEILFVLPGGFLFRPWPLIPGLPALIALGYRWVADHRSLLARLLRID